METDLDIQDIEKHYAMNGGSFDVLLDSEGEIVGTVGVYRISATVCELRKMYLVPSQRGQGKGKLLLEHGLCRAKEFGYARIILETARVLKEAISLYKKYGFKEYEADHVSGRCDQTYYLEIRD